jgi:hypothetical protein
MTKKQENEEITLIKEYMKEVLSSKENSQKFLRELGTNDANGKLTKRYS